MKNLITVMTTVLIISGSVNSKDILLCEGTAVSRPCGGWLHSCYRGSRFGTGREPETSGAQVRSPIWYNNNKRMDNGNTVLKKVELNLGTGKKIYNSSIHILRIFGGNFTVPQILGTVQTPILLEAIYKLHGNCEGNFTVPMIHGMVNQLWLLR